MEQLQDVILKQALLNLLDEAAEEIKNCEIDPKRVPLINPQVIINIANEIINTSVLAPVKLNHIERLENYQSGGNCGIDFIYLHDGTILSLTEDSICHWRSLNDWEEDTSKIKRYSELALDNPTKAEESDCE